MKLAKEIVNEEAKKEGISKSVISYAVSMNTLTNIMWYNSSSKLKTDQKYPSKYILYFKSTSCFIIFTREKYLTIV